MPEPIERYGNNELDSFAFPICGECKHWQDNNTCPAFPGGIPEDIRTGKFNHIRMYPGQTGETVFELNED